MGQQDRCRAQIQAATHDLARIGLHRRHRAGRQLFIGEQAVGGIEKQNAKLFDRLEGHPGPQIVEDRRFTRQHRSLKHPAPQNLLHGDAQVLERMLDAGHAAQDHPPVAGPRCQNVPQGTKPLDEATGDLARGVGTGRTDQIFQGASAPKRVRRVRCRQVATISITCAAQLHTATATP